MVTKKRLPKADPNDDPAMARVRVLWAEKKNEGWTQQRLGELMGYPTDSARKSVNQFFKTHDPKVSTLRRFAKALGITPAELFAED